MFTGIIEELAKVSDIRESKDYMEFDIASQFSQKIKKGDSISINGVCLTATATNEEYFTVNVVSETLNKSNLRDIQTNSYVNLERAMKMSSRLDGHIVQGHVESISTIIKKETINEQTNLVIDIDAKLLKYCIYKGSIALDGISLTIAKIKDNSITIAIIPHTLENTTLKDKGVGDRLNIETDMFAKYVEKSVAGKIKGHGYTY